MPVRLNITIDADLYASLKRELPPKGISRFISEAIRARLRPSRARLDAAYRAAATEAWRQAESDAWSKTEIEDWPVKAAAAPWRCGFSVIRFGRWTKADWGRV